MRKVSSEVEQTVVILTKNGVSTREIAKQLKLAVSTVVAVRNRRKVIPVSNVGGRPRLLTNADARQMVRRLAIDDIKTPKEAAIAINKEVSEWTARRAFRRIGFVSAVKQKKPALSNKNIKARLKFCQTHKNWTVEDWKRVIWSDETKINRFQSDGKQYYWHRPHETIQKHQVKETVKHGGGSLMVWGCFTWWHIGPLVKICGIMRKENYLDILQTNLTDFVDKSAYPEEEVVFQQDNDPKHTAKIVTRWLHSQRYHLIQWPAQSPDLNPIENLWAIVKKRLGNYRTAPSNMDELWSRVQTEWRSIPKEIIENLVESMPRRVKSVIKHKGLWTKY